MNRSLSTADTRSALFFTMVHLGAIATLLLVATLVVDLPDFIDGLAQGLLLASVGMILLRRLRDEYIEELWRAGTTAAFVLGFAALLLLPLLVTGVEHFLTGSGDPRDLSAVIQWPLAVMLTGFYGGFYRRMIADRAR